jgi:hypothetical protein
LGFETQKSDAGRTAVEEKGAARDSHNIVKRRAATFNCPLKKETAPDSFFVGIRSPRTERPSAPGKEKIFLPTERSGGREFG